MLFRKNNKRLKEEIEQKNEIIQNLENLLLKEDKDLVDSIIEIRKLKDKIKQIEKENKELKQEVISLNGFGYTRYKRRRKSSN